MQASDCRHIAGAPMLAFVGTAQTFSAAAQQAGTKGVGALLTPQFKNIQLSQLGEFGERFCEKEFTLETDLSTKVDLSSATAITAEEFCTTIIELLRAAGLEVHDSGKAIYVSRRVTAASNEIVAHITSTKERNGRQATSLIEPYLSSEGSVISSPREEFLLVTDTRENMELIRMSLDERDAAASGYTARNLASYTVVRAQPVVDGNGSMAGLRVYPGKMRTTFFCFGLQPGDLVTAFEGADFTGQSFDSPNTHAQLQRVTQAIDHSSTKLSLTIARNGQTMDLEIDSANCR